MYNTNKYNCDYRERKFNSKYAEQVIIKLNINRINLIYRNKNLEKILDG